MVRLSADGPRPASQGSPGGTQAGAPADAGDGPALGGAAAEHLAPRPGASGVSAGYGRRRRPLSGAEGIRISVCPTEHPRHPHLHGRQGPVDRVFIERLWRSLKYECVYLQAFADFGEARDGIGAWVSYYNEQRPHSVFDGLTPAEQRLDRAA